MKRQDKASADKTSTGKAYTIIHSRDGHKAETIETGLSAEQARAWLKRKAGEVSGSMSRDLTVKSSTGEVWSAVEAE